MTIMMNTFLIVCKMWALEINYSSMIIILIKRIRKPSLTSRPNCDVLVDRRTGRQVDGSTGRRVDGTGDVRDGADEGG